MSRPTTRGAERRAFERIPLRFPIVVHTADAAPIRGLCVDLSGNGILIAIPCRVELGREIELVLELPDGLPPLAVRCLPVRVDGNGKAGPPFRMGLHFILPASESVRRIRKLIYGS